MPTFDPYVFDLEFWKSVFPLEKVRKWRRYYERGHQVTSPIDMAMIEQIREAARQSY